MPSATYVWDAHLVVGQVAGFGPEAGDDPDGGAAARGGHMPQATRRSFLVISFW